MKAIRVREFGPPEFMKLEDCPDLSAGQGQVLMEVKAAGVNPVDAYVRTGAYARKPELPYTPGSDAAGLVLSVGRGVPGLSPGDRVYASGTLSGAYAAQALCDASQIHPLPSNVTFSQGAAVYIPYGTAYHALFQTARARPAETVLVHGATGGVGVAAVQLARAGGIRVIGTGGSPKGRELVLRQGADHVLDHRDPGHMDRIAELTEGRGVEVVIEMLANVNLGRDLEVLDFGGRVVVVGSRGRVEINPRDLMARGASVRGILLYTATPAQKADIFAALAAGLSNGSLEPVVGHELPLSEAPRAHHEVMDGPAYGKIVLVP